jgi:hypothetical protein
VGAICLLCTAVALASCQWAAGLSGPIGTSSSTAGDAAAAAETVATYLDALASGRYPDAWKVLAPSSRETWGDEQQFATERSAYYTSAGPSADVSAPDNSTETLAAWIPRGFDGNRHRAYAINVDHPRIQSNASREVLIVAPDSSGEWRIWIGR